MGVSRVCPGARLSVFGHIGDGNIHIIVSQPKEGDKRSFMGLKPAIHDLVYGAALGLGGSFSAEHGIGDLKVIQLEQFTAPAALELMRSIKTAIDPLNILNPGKILRQSTPAAP
jgi:FAD/FMN-containing dehydrogenase